jgi:anthranilate/para-aminobenzoate synthase component II
MSAPRILLIDNYDSFTYNLYQFLSELGAEVEVVRNDQISIEACLAKAPDRVVISPGPGNPDEAGISKEVIRAFAGKVPVLGVCLGHQCIYEVFGGVVTGAGEILHGKQSSIHHDQDGLFTIASRLRSRVSFEYANLTAPLPQLGSFDVVVLRNVMIYFADDTKRQLLERISAVLRPGGYLLTGHAESIAGLNTPFRPVAPSVYQILEA